MELPLARGLLGELTPLAEAERHGVLEVRADAVAFRHELARRAVEGSLPSSTRMELNARVLATLPGFPGADPARMVHHAVAAGNGAAVVAFAPAAARRANRAGAHAQEVALYAAALEQPLDAPERADMLQASAQALFAMDRVAEAALAAVEAVRIREERSEPGPLAEALTTLAPIEWARYRPAGALATAMRAVELLESDGDSPRRAFALAYAGLLLVAIDRYGESLPLADAAVAMARRLRAAGLEALGLALRGGSRLMLGDDEGLVELEAGVRMGAAVPDHATVMIGYVLAVEDLWALGRFADVERYVEAGLAYSRERDLGLYVEHLQAHRLRLSALRGDWAGAEDGLPPPGRTAGAETAADRYSLPALAQLLVRRGADDAGERVDRAYDLAVRPTPSGTRACGCGADRARVADRAAGTRPATRRAASRTAHRGRCRARPCRASAPPASARRAGRPLPRLPRGVCRRPSRRLVGRSGGVGTVGDPYARALELADSGEVEPTLEALRVLDGLGARPAAAVVRKRLRDLGVTAVPRGPQSTTRTNPAGLTDRQAEILRLVARGLTNGEIAARLVVSVRTVDHHVSAVLQKLGVASRRDAAAAAGRLGLE